MSGYLLVFSLSLLAFIRIYKPLLKLRTKEEDRADLKMRKDLDDVKTIAQQSKLNPHFIGNLLNLAQARLQSGRPQLAAEILDKVGNLSKLSFEISNHPSISLERELEFLRLYLEACRLLTSFTYQIEVDESVKEDDLFDFELPVFLIQPYVENAIMHGIKSRNDQNGVLIIQVEKIPDNELAIRIKDNGRFSVTKSSAADRVSSTMINLERLDLFARQNNRNSRIHYHQDKESEGALVEIII